MIYFAVMGSLVVVITVLSASIAMMSCGNMLPGNHPAKTQSEIIDFSATPSPTPDVQQDEALDYPGKTLDQVFPMIESHDFQDTEYKEKTFDVTAAGYEVEISRYIPRFLKKGSRPLIRFGVEPGEYWSNLVGVSQLLGPKSEQIYIVANGPGGVCCTNYWIVGVTFDKPAIIFRSQDFGGFRNPLEISDDDNDGIYELVQFDSCMRYFRDDCGSCSPEPRAYFEYDKKRKSYWPTKGIQQNFVKEQYANTEEWLNTAHEELKRKKDISRQTDLRRTLLAHISNLVHIGEERKAWGLFAKFHDVVDDGDRVEFRRRLAQCKFYKALRSRK